jgi:hypothetical protein
MSTVVYIMNHNLNQNSENLYSFFSEVCRMDCFILHSGQEKFHDSVILTGGSSYVSIINKGLELQKTTHSNYDWAFYIASDVKVNENLYIDFISKLGEYNNFGIISPSVDGRALGFMKNQGNGEVRKVPFCEGMVFALQRDIAKIVPLFENNEIGYGCDVYMAYKSWLVGKDCGVSDKAFVYHPDACSYSNQEACRQYEVWYNSLPDKNEFANFKEVMQA